MPFKVIQGHWFCYYRKPACDFLLVNNTNSQHPISHRFASYCRLLVKFPISTGGRGTFLQHSFGVEPHKLSSTKFGLRKVETSLYRGLQCFNILNSLGAVHECDRQTDRHTDASEPALAIAWSNDPR